MSVVRHPSLLTCLRLPPLSVLFDEEKFTLDEALEKIALGPITARNKIVVDFHCRCSREKYLQQLIALSPKNKHHLLGLEENPDNQDVEVNCQFCNETFIFTKQELS